MIDVDLCRDSTLMMISAEVVERIVTINDNSPPQNYSHPDNQTATFNVVPEHSINYLYFHPQSIWNENMRYLIERCKEQIWPSRRGGGAPNVLEIRKAWFQVACNTDMKERNVETDGHSPNVMIMFSRLDDLPYSLTYGATLQALR